MKASIILLLLALPAAAQECFAGKPQQLTYDNGKVATIIQRHGDDLTYTQPYEGFQDTVTKTHLMLFPKTSRAWARATEYRWTSKLPKLSQLVPGYHFDLKGTMQSGGGSAKPYRSAGDVLAPQVIKVGGCPYEVMVVKSTTYLGGAAIATSTDYLSAELGVVLRSEIILTSTGSQITRAVVALH